MDRKRLQQGNELLQLRQTNAAWQLLASRIAPFIIACLQRLFEPGQRTSVEDMELALADLLHENANQVDGIEANVLQQARRELRNWISRGLITERAGELTATDDLQRTLQFIDGLQDRIMTSTASRLATVQREIADLAMHLNPDAQAREERLLAMIAELQEEVAKVRSGNVDVREGDAAIESIRDVYDLAVSLRSDFRRVEDSYREAERELRQSLVANRQHRGQAIDRLLDSHDALVETPEGQVFSVFHQQLNERAETDRMRNNLREIARHDLVSEALNRHQRDELSYLVMRLITESRNVIRARARSDRDVKGFIKSGLAAEHFTVSQLLGDLFSAAQDIDWSRQALRRFTTPLPLVATNLPAVPIPTRLRVVDINVAASGELDLTPVQADLDAMGDNFWLSFDGLNRQDFLDQVNSCLTDNQAPMTVAEIATELVTEHDLEAVALLVALGREVNDVTSTTESETCTINSDEGTTIIYTVPRLSVDVTATRLISVDRL